MKKTLSTEEIAGLEGKFVEKAKEGFKKMFGEDGYNGLVTFRQKEDRACEITDELWEWLMEKHVETDEQTDIQEWRCQCPKCGARGKSRKEKEGEMLEDREIMGKRGQVECKREGYYCDRCRISFFPSGQTNGTRDGRIQSQSA